MNNDFKNRYLYFHYPHYRTAMPHSAIVSGSKKVMHFYESPDIPMLFDLDNDRGEVKNIAQTNSKEHKKLYTEMRRYFEEVGVRIPKAASNYDIKKYKKAKEYKTRILWGAFEGERALEDDEK